MKTSARTWHRWHRRVVGALLPSPCLACGDPRPTPEEISSRGLCRACHGQLRPALPSCRGCLKELRAASAPPGYLCASCRRRPPAYDHLWARWSYEGPLEAVMKAFKYGRLDYLGAALAKPLAEVLEAGGLETEGLEIASLHRVITVDVVVPMPLHWQRRLSRGFNQAERIARPLAQRWGLPLSQTLRRHRATGRQSRLGRQQRGRNLRAAFGVSNNEAIAQRRVLLVDDVATTGATLRAAASCLRQAGASEVVAAVLATTPRQR